MKNREVRIGDLLISGKTTYLLVGGHKLEKENEVSFTVSNVNKLVNEQVLVHTIDRGIENE